MTEAVKTAGLIIIGNEVLTGKVQDENSPFAVAELRKLGVELKQIAVIPDEIEVIATTVRNFSKRFTWVFTTGGLGPTHDDVTMEAIAAAFSVPFVESNVLVELVNRIESKEKRDVLQRMTMVPEGAQVFWGDDDGDRVWPTIHMNNVYIFPGVPRLFRARFGALRSMLKSTPVVCHMVYASLREVSIVQALNQTVSTFDDVEVGSYPQFGDEDHRVRVTFETRDEERVEKAVQHFVEQIGPSNVVRIQRQATDETPKIGLP